MIVLYLFIFQKKRKLLYMKKYKNISTLKINGNTEYIYHKKYQQRFLLKKEAEIFLT